MLEKSFPPDDKTKCKVTFIVKEDAAQGAESISLAGDFNCWSSTETTLTKRKDGSFSVTLDLEAGKEYQFRYLFNGTRWENDWEADKYIPAPFSNTDNSVVVCVAPAESETAKNVEVPAESASEEKPAKAEKQPAKPRKTTAKKPAAAKKTTK